MLIKLFSKQWAFGWKLSSPRDEFLLCFMLLPKQRLGGNFIIISQFRDPSLSSLFIHRRVQTLFRHWFIPFVCQKFNDIFSPDLWPKCMPICFVLSLTNNVGGTKRVNERCSRKPVKFERRQIKNGLRMQSGAMSEQDNESAAPKCRWLMLD